MSNLDLEGGEMRKAVGFSVFYMMIVSLGGCGKPLFIETVTSEFSVQQGNATIASTADPRVGQIMFSGLYTPLVTEAEVSIDGIRVGTFRSGGMPLVASTSLGRHTVSAEVYLLIRDQRSQRIGCYRRQFEVSPYYRTNDRPGFWWLVEIGSPSPYCPKEGA